MANKSKAANPADVSTNSGEALAGRIERADIMAELLDTDTIRETNTVVEDRTENPDEPVEVEYEVSEMQLDGGTILTSYGDAVSA